MFLVLMQMKLKDNLKICYFIWTYMIDICYKNALNMIVYVLLTQGFLRKFFKCNWIKYDNERT